MMYPFELTKIGLKWGYAARLTSVAAKFELTKID